MSSFESKSYETNQYNNLLELLETVRSMEKLETELIIKNESNSQKLNNYVQLLEEIISEYHILAMKIFNS